MQWSEQIGYTLQWYLTQSHTTNLASRRVIAVVLTDSIVILPHFFDLNMLVKEIGINASGRLQWWKLTARVM